MAQRRYIDAINDGLFEEMTRDSDVIVFGQDVEIGVMLDTRGLAQKFGKGRIRNTPVCEATLTGMAVGAAAAGYRVVLQLMFSNFIYTGFDAIANQMAKLRVMTGGQVSLPITVLACYGGGMSNGAQHSDSPYPLLMNLGGLNVVTPATAGDAKGLLKEAIRGSNPTFFMESFLRAGDLGEVPEHDYTIALGKAEVVKSGSDVTLIAIGPMLKPTLEASANLAAKGVDAEVVDPRTLVPLDEETLITSVSKTGRVVVVDEARDRCSAASHISAILADKCFETLRAPIKRVTVPDVCLPYAAAGEKRLIPDAQTITDVAFRLLGSRGRSI